MNKGPFTGLRSRGRNDAQQEQEDLAWLQIDSPNVTYPQSSPFFSPGSCRISSGGSRFEYLT